MNGVSAQFTAEVAVIGGGPAGLVSAIALAAAGVDTLLDRAAAPSRITAPPRCLSSSVTALQTLGVWQACLPHAAPLKKLRIVDDTQRLFRAPEVSFAAAEIGLEAFGYNIENRHLLAALEARAAELKLPRIAAPALAIKSDAAGVTIKLCRRRGARAARGRRRRRSARSAAPPPASARTRRTYPQTALTLNLAHARPHDDTSTEFHTESGPFTLVPLPGRRSSLVCVLDPAGAAELSAHERRRAVGRDRAPRPFAARQDERRAGPRRLSARGRDRGCLCARAHRAGRRSGACGAADRRAGSQSRPARRRHHRRNRRRRAAAKISMSARRTCSRATTRSAAPM